MSTRAAPARSSANAAGACSAPSIRPHTRRQGVFMRALPSVQSIAGAYRPGTCGCQTPEWPVRRAAGANYRLIANTTQTIAYSFAKYQMAREGEDDESNESIGP